jgi:peroxiredoxin Q/BCP
LLYFYPKDDTPGCTKEACDIRDNFGRFGKQGLRVLGVSPDSEKSHAKFGKKYGLPFTLLSDPEKTLASAYGVWGLKNNYGKEYMGIIRSSFLVGADGEIKKAYRGVKVAGHVDAVLSDAEALLQ